MKALIALLITWKMFKASTQIWSIYRKSLKIYPLQIWNLKMSPERFQTKNSSRPSQTEIWRTMMSGDAMIAPLIKWAQATKLQTSQNIRLHPHYCGDSSASHASPHTQSSAPASITLKTRISIATSFTTLSKLRITAEWIEMTNIIKSRTIWESQFTNARENGRPLRSFGSLRSL